MGRKRKDNPLGLPPRVYARHGAFYYAHIDGRWERIGTDVTEARARGHLYNDSTSQYGTVAYWYGMFLADCHNRIGLPKKRRGISQRTYDDYLDAQGPLAAYFGKMLPHQVQGFHVAAYLDAGVVADRAVRANRERAALSSCFSWLKRQPSAKMRGPNPCFGIARNPEQKRERYVEHDEYQKVYQRAVPSVRILMDFVYRTLQRPEDSILWTPGDIVRKNEANETVQRVLRTGQNKTDAIVDIRVTPEIEAILAIAQPDGVRIGPGMTYIHTRKGKPYGYPGLSAMFRRYVDAAVEAGDLSEPFTMYDIKGKGATDMWLSGTPLEQIQVLCGHESVTTTEKYVKCRWRGTVEPNKTAMSAA
jgi:integrase